MTGQNAQSLTPEERQARENLITTLITGITTAAGGDATLTLASAQIEIENNSLNKAIPLIPIADLGQQLEEAIEDQQLEKNPLMEEDLQVKETEAQAVQSVEKGVVADSEMIAQVAAEDAVLNLDTSNFESKIRDYLFNPDHPQNQSKSDWFEKALGFNQDNWEEFAKQIYFDPSRVIVSESTPYGQKYEQLTPIVGANGKVIEVPIIFIKTENGTVRFITSFPPPRG